MRKTFLILGAFLLLIILIIGGYMWRFYLSPYIRGFENTIDSRIQQMDDKTRYETQKKVEDTCRAMISSYTTDKLTYEQYKDSSNEEKQGWAEQAKMRANKTASTYNNYILDNSFIWQANVPKDICMELSYLD